MQLESDCGRARRTNEIVCAAIRRAGITCVVTYDRRPGDGVEIDWNGDVVAYETEADALAAVAEAAG